MTPNEPLPHPRVLAHLGDAVYSLWVREAGTAIHRKSVDLHRYTTLRVQADTQAALLEALWPELPPHVQQLAKRAQNMPLPAQRRKNQWVYRKATAFEAIVGYWYLFESDRLDEHKARSLTLLEAYLASNRPS